MTNVSKPVSQIDLNLTTFSRALAIKPNLKCEIIILQDFLKINSSYGTRALEIEKYEKQNFWQKIFRKPQKLTRTRYLMYYNSNPDTNVYDIDKSRNQIATKFLHKCDTCAKQFNDKIYGPVVIHKLVNGQTIDVNAIDFKFLESL